MLVLLAAGLIILAGCTAPKPAPLEPATKAGADQGSNDADSATPPAAPPAPASPPASPPSPAPASLPPNPAPAPVAPASPLTPSGTLRIHYVNVGQGDAVIWELPGGDFVVYDCGPSASSGATNAVVRRLESLGLVSGGTLHALIASHGHLDHIGGCEEILQSYRVLHLYEAWYDGADAPASYTRFRDQVKSEGGVVHVLASTSSLEGEVVFRVGENLSLPEAGVASGVQAQILWPPAFQANDWDDIAHSSIALRLSFGAVDFCFQGDIEEAQEAALAQQFPPRDCEIYLVGHHGSRYASRATWLAAMDPEFAVVSYGNNSYGHPSKEALCRVQQVGAGVYATKVLGTITVATDGRDVVITPATPDATDHCATTAPATPPPPSPIVTPPAPAPAPAPPPPPPPPPSPPEGSSQVRITAEQHDPQGDDLGENLVNEWIELTNEGAASVDLTGWKLKDAANSPHTYSFPSGFTLAAAAKVKVRTGVGSDTATDLYWDRNQAVWNNNGGDTAYLYDAQGNLVDSRTW